MVDDQHLNYREKRTSVKSCIIGNLERFLVKRRSLFAALSVIALILLSVSGIFVHRSFELIPETLRLNGELKSEGYYMGEFEFKMLGLVYYLDRGQYTTAFFGLKQLHEELESRKGLIKVPEFADKNEEMEFFLSLQNPRTGAFMNDSYPLFTYIGPTLNVLEHLELLANETDKPLQLKYPLRFLDQINTEEKLTAFLDDISTVGWMGSRFKTPYIEAAELTYYPEKMESYKLYTFSPEWQHALLKWFYENQDSKTGFWGPRLRSNGQLINSGDLGATFHIVKLFVDDNGKNIHPEFPLRYKEEMFTNALQKLSEPMPAEADLAELHDWSLTRSQGIKLLTNMLWNDASPEDKNKAKKLMENIIKIKFEQFYVQRDGGFSLYPGSEHADLDGTGGVLNLLDIIGAFSSERQELLWGSPNETIVNLGVYEVSELKESDFTYIKDLQDINSIRLCRNDPGSDNYSSSDNSKFSVVGIVYPRETQVMDVRDLMPKVSHFVNTTSQNFGNWASKEQITKGINVIDAQPVPVSKGDTPLELANEVLRNEGELIVVGLDVLQVPRYKIVFRSGPGIDHGSLGDISSPLKNIESSMVQTSSATQAQESPTNQPDFSFLLPQQRQRRLIL